MSTEIARQSDRRRTFAIISHPDAGKTTLTEKLLLYGGAIQLAGAVKGRKAARHATSDWMELEKQRGISVTSSVMQFPYREHVVNLLDTPGHADFSEDTYRTLTAVDSALMVIDGAKGVEERTIKLMDVCRMRTTPIMTFINKLDRESRDPVELMDEVEAVLDIQCAPVTWPIGSGQRFRGVYHLVNDRVHLFSARHGGKIQTGELVDSALMVIDGAKGVEERTIKLMDVCRMRTTPIMTFINKLDRESRDPVELMDEVEAVLDIQCAPVTWPIGSGQRFRGVYHLVNDRVHLFSARHGGKIQTGEVVQGIENPLLDQRIGEQAAELREEVELVRGASHSFDPLRYRQATLTPVFFGSAINNFGVEELLETFVTHALAPCRRDAEERSVTKSRQCSTFSAHRSPGPLAADSDSEAFIIW